MGVAVAVDVAVAVAVAVSVGVDVHVGVSVGVDVDLKRSKNVSCFFCFQPKNYAVCSMSHESKHLSYHAFMSTKT